MFKEEWKGNKKEALNIHFPFEFNMMKRIMIFHNSLINSNAENSVKGIGTNICITGFLLHTRNLLAFFYYKAHGDYIRAEDFIGEGKVWNNIRPGRTHLLKNFEKRVNNELSHLSYNRVKVDYPGPKWKIDGIYGDLVKVIKIFLDNIDEIYIDQPIKILKEEWASQRKIPIWGSKLH